MKHLFAITSLVLALSFSACNNHSANWTTLNDIESYIEDNPDSALATLKRMSKDELSGDKEHAKYAILLSMALDKAYIDKTDFDVLQPAIDFYLKHGHPNDKLRTCYYQGRIYQNKGDRDQALKSFEKGLAEIEICTDSLLIIRTLAAQAVIYYELYDFKGYTKNNLEAAKISKEISHKGYEFERLMNALNGAMILEDRSCADSLINLCSNFNNISDRQKQSLLGYQLSYILKFKSKQDLKQWIDNHKDNLHFDLNGILNLALAYNTIGYNSAAKNILDSIVEWGVTCDTLKHQSILVSVLKDMGNYKDALYIRRIHTTS